MSEPSDTPPSDMERIEGSLFRMSANMQYLRDQMATFDFALNDPEGRIRLALHDILETYGQLVQFRELSANQRDSAQAQTEVLTMLLGRVIALSRTLATQHTAMLERFTALAHSLDQADIAAEAAAARQVIHAAEQEHLAELAHAEDRAKELLSIARQSARGDIQHAVNCAEAEIARAAVAGQAEISADADTARGVVADAADVARDALREEATEGDAS